MLGNLKVPVIDIPKDERVASVTGYKAQVYYRAGDLIPALCKYIVRDNLIQLRSKILTHLAFALGARPAQLAGIDEENFVSLSRQALRRWLYAGLRNLPDSAVDYLAVGSPAEDFQ